MSNDTLISEIHEVVIRIDERQKTLIDDISDHGERIRVIEEWKTTHTAEYDRDNMGKTHYWTILLASIGTFIGALSAYLFSR